jgi:excisionase family DNA binding protein
MPVLEDYLTVTEAAEELGLTPGAIRRAIMRGLIEPVRLGKRANLISRTQIAEYRAEHRGRTGRPAKTDKKADNRPAKPAP